MLYWLHQHYVVVWLLSFVVMFVIFGGWYPIMNWRRILFADLDEKGRADLQIIVVLVTVSFFGALAFSGVIGFTYKEDPDIHYSKVSYEQR